MCPAAVGPTTGSSFSAGKASYRLLALDLDGTIVDAHMQVSSRVRAAIGQATRLGVHVTLASGRPFQHTRSFADDLGIVEPLICYQGAVVHDRQEALPFLHLGVPAHLAKECIDLAREQDWDICLHLHDRLFAERATARLRFYAEYSPMKEELHLVDSLYSMLEDDPTKLVLVVDAAQCPVVTTMVREQFQDRLSVVQSFAQFVEMTHVRASKGQALAFLARKLGVARKETMAIGDNDNDIDMIRWAGLGVAMGNGSDATKAAADLLAPRIDEDGVAAVIEELILGDRSAAEN